MIAFIFIRAKLSKFSLFGHFLYYTFIFKGRFIYKPGQARAFGMLAGGSGITPMFQVGTCAFKKLKLLLVHCLCCYLYSYQAFE